MGFDEGQLVLDNPNVSYYSGQTVQGRLIFQQDKVKSLSGIYVKLKGFCHVHWTTKRTRTVHGKKKTHTVNHTSHEEYINYKVYLVGGESGDHTIQPGNYEYPFHFRLPADCPASFEGSYGHIRYEIKAVVDRAFKFDQEKKLSVRVVAPLDLNLDPYCKEPIELQFEESYSCCCISTGAADVSVTLPIAGYCPGQTIPIEVVCSNKGNVVINDIKLCITKCVTFIATDVAGRRKDRETVVEIKKGPIQGNTNRNWTVEMEVPAMDVYNLFGCQYIELEYEFKVVVNPKGCYTDSVEFRKMVIGTVPLEGLQDHVPNPLQDQLPQPIPQPVSAYPPTINAYTKDNLPFNPQAYPGNSPYCSLPYPNENQPNQQYPPNSSSYPSANPSYPNITPYRDNPPPYPGNLTDPASNPSDSNEKSPFLDANSPNVPYETKSNPSPGYTGGLEAGYRGHGINLPLMPPNDTAAYHSQPRTPSPYAAATAPALDPPGITNSTLPDK